MTMLRNLHSVLLLLLLLAVSCKESGTTTATQFDVSMLSAEGQDAYRDIDTITCFCSEHIGIGGRTPSVVWSFRELLKEDLSAEAFKGLLQSANTAGKLYALCGLYYADSTYFMQAVTPFRNSKDTVLTFISCMVSSDSVCQIIESNDSLTVHLAGRDDSIGEWCERIGTISFNLDIIGGGWPNSLKGDSELHNYPVVVK